MIKSPEKNDIVVIDCAPPSGRNMCSKLRIIVMIVISRNAIDENLYPLNTLLISSGRIFSNIFLMSNSPSYFNILIYLAHLTKFSKK